jgi:RHS repeat-associated protein
MKTPNLLLCALLTAFCFESPTAQAQYPDEGTNDIWSYYSSEGEEPSEDTDEPVEYCEDCDCKSGEIVKTSRPLLPGEKANEDGSCPQPEGMAYYLVDLKGPSLRITDRPLGYSAPYGPGTRVILNYNSNDASALPFPRYSNLGPRWKFNFVQFVELDPIGTQDSLNKGSGYRGKYDDDGGGQRKSVSGYGHDKLVRLTAQHYEHRLTDGTVESYTFSGGVGSNGRERLFLTSIKDRYDHTVTLTWQNVADAPGVPGGARLTKITDATGKETNVFYENAAFPMRITKISDPFGRSVTIQYNVTGLLWKLTDPVGIVSEFNYSGSFVSSMVTPYGTTTFQRDFLLSGTGGYLGRYLHITEPEGQQHRIEQHVWLDGSEFGTEPLPTGFTSEMRSGPYTLYWNPAANGAGRTLSNAYASQRKVDPATSAITSAVSSFKAPLTNREWATYGNPLTPGATGATRKASSIVQVQPNGAIFTRSGTETANGLPATLSDGFGRTVTYEYHGSSRDLHRVRHSAVVAGTPVENTLLTLENYDNRRPGKATDVDGTVTWLYYNVHGQLHRIVNANNEETRIIHNDTVGSAIRGRRTGVTEAYGTTLARTTGFEYDAYCRLWKVTNHEGDLTTLEYDAIGGNPLATLNRPTRIIYPDLTSERVEWENLHVKKYFDIQNRATVYEYDGNGDVSSVTTPDNKTVSYLRGNCCGGGIDTIVDAAGNKTHWNYDILGRVTEKWLRWETPQAVRVQLQTYDTVGRPATATDGRGNLRTFAYNDQGRMQYIYYTIAPGSTKATPTVNFNYEPVFGRPSFINDGTGSHTLAYVPFNPGDTVYGDGQLASITTAGTNFASYSHTYTYDKLGRESGSVLAGVSRSSQWDGLGRLFSITNPLGVTTLGYQGMSDRVLTVDAAGALTTTFGYEDPAQHKHKLLSITHTKPGESIPYSSHTYGYDSLERLNAWAKYTAFPGNPALGNIEKKWDMFYDSSDQLQSVGEITKVNGGAPAATDLHSYAYDAVGNRTSEQRTGGIRSWQANGFNQLTAQQVGGQVEVRGTSNVNSTVTVDGQPASTWQDGTQWRWRKTVNAASGENTFAIQATEATVPPGFVPQVTNKTLQFNVTPAPAVTYSYDADGNVLTDGYNSYEWDAKNRLVAVTNSTTGRIEFAYDAFSRRVRITEPASGSSTRVYYLIWDDLTIVQQKHYLGGVLQDTRDYFGAGERRTSSSSAVQTLLYTNDHLGSIREVVDKDTSAVRVRYDYSPYGIRTKAPGSWNFDADFGFTGHYTNDRSGLVLAPYRAFDSKLGRWLSRDPIGEDGGFNLFRYVGGSPLNYWDPDGLAPRPGPPPGADGRWKKYPGCKGTKPNWVDPKGHTWSWHDGDKDPPGRRHKDHWDVKDKHGKKTRRHPTTGEDMGSAVDDERNRAERPNSDGGPGKKEEEEENSAECSTAAKWGAAVIIGISIGSRILYPPRNLLPF